MNRNAVAWLLMVSSVGIHVVDEALTGFLPFYNDLVLSIRDRVSFFPAPTFTFPVWITGLAIAVAGGIAFTILVVRGGPIVRFVCGAMGVLMILNGLGHMLGSVYLGRILPGFWSSPLLVGTSAWVVSRAVRGPRAGRA